MIRSEWLQPDIIWANVSGRMSKDVSCHMCHCGTCAVSVTAKSGCTQDERVSSVRVGNELAIRTTALCLVGWTTKVGYIIEQPVSSLLKHFPSVQLLFEHTNPECISTFMGAFEGTTPKPLLLWGTARWIGALKRTRPTALRSGGKALVKKKGKQVTGIRGALKDSQSYTLAFGKAAATARMEEKSERSHSCAGQPRLAY